MKTALIILAILAAIVGFVYYRWNRIIRVTKETQYGPFVIKAEARTGKVFNLNYGMVDQTNVAYSIWYNGKPVQFPGALESNTALPYLWKVFAIADAPEPTLLAGSQSLFLIALRNGQPVVTTLLQQFSDFASLQFLDSEAGQPGAEFKVFSMSQAEGMEKLDTLQAGQLLLVGGHTVFNIRTGQQVLFSKDSNDLDNYSFPDMDKGAIAFSPDRRSIVFHGNFQTWNTNDTNYIPHAMVVFDYEQDKGYTVTYDDTETRLSDPSNISRSWFNNCFEWVKDAEGKDRLQRKPHDQPLNWLGRYLVRDNYYYLYPVKPTMLPVFLDFVLAQMGWDKANIVEDKTMVYSGRTITLADADTKLDITYREDEQEISFHKHLYLPNDDNKYPALTRKIANAFDAELAVGKWQECFGEVKMAEY